MPERDRCGHQMTAHILSAGPNGDDQIKCVRCGRVFEPEAADRERRRQEREAAVLTKQPDKNRVKMGGMDV